MPASRPRQNCRLVAVVGRFDTARPNANKRLGSGGLRHTSWFARKDLAQLAQIKKDVGGSKSQFEKVAREKFSPERAREIKLSTGMHERYQIDRMMAGEITMADC
ncbi:hypothetical protein FIBSPDRAFT_232205 [Athelia psychrophila]|uniref:Uncharacterized protein n=1 Tax=Athelia psychrophila TaxID=1759441 RepID=A0A165YIY2_9AGAM|nr:hypothetical protein FIBSPDRAFT_232205 [Fibularhizoctonia sp. CBS 109695]